MNRFSDAVKTLLKDATLTTLVLLKIMIPVSIVVKLLAEFGFIEIIGTGLAPLMSLVGLPGSFGLVWATAMATNIYGGLIVFFSLSLTQTFTVSQVTVLGVLILLAHNLPIEARITQKGGIRLWYMLVLRVGGAFVLGWLLNLFFTTFNIYNTPSSLLWSSGFEDPSLLYWVIGECRNYFMIFLIILGLLTLMYILKKIGVIEKLNSLFEPGLNVLGMSKNVAPLAIIGMTLGLAYGGGLILRETKTGLLSKKDTFLSLSLLGLSHSLIEDTILLLTIGASLVGILLGRVLFTIVVLFIIIYCINYLSDYRFMKYFFKER
ncbi:MAG: hypothetical protein R6V50_03365 [Thermoplasmatota archaeon]